LKEKIINFKKKFLSSSSMMGIRYDNQRNKIAKKKLITSLNSDKNDYSTINSMMNISSITKNETIKFKNKFRTLNSLTPKYFQ